MINLGELSPRTTVKQTLGLLSKDKGAMVCVSFAIVMAKSLRKTSLKLKRLSKPENFEIIALVLLTDCRLPTKEWYTTL